MAQKFVTPVTIRNLASASSDGLAVSVDGDTNDRIKFEAGGRVVWGSGASAGDVNMYRSGVGALKTDHTFEAESGIITLTTSGTPVASVADGALAVDTTNDDLYFRSNGAWKKVDNVAAVSDTAPSNPQEGDIWFESDTGDFFIYYSSAWVDIGGSSVANIAVTTTPPSSPVNGDLWFDTDTAKTYVYYNDGTSGQWVEIGAASAAASGADGAIQFASGGTFSSDASNLVWDDSNNRLGIGTASPTAHFEVNAGSLGGTAGDSVRAQRWYGTVTNGSFIDFKQERWSNGTDWNTAGWKLQHTVDSTPMAFISFSPDDAPRGLDFGTNNVTRMTIDQNGNVGIGTTAPDFSLDVNGQAIIGGGDNRTPNGLGDGHLMIAGAGYTGFASLDGTAMWVGHNSGSRSLYLATDETARVTITGGGNVGIGDTSPSEKLTVNGNAKIGTATEYLLVDYDDDQKLELVENNATGRPYLSISNQDASGNLDRKGFFGFPENASNTSSIRVVSEQGSLLLLASGFQWTLGLNGNTTFPSTGVIESDGTYANTTASAANMHISSGGFFFRSTSSIKYKTDVETLDDDHADIVFQLRPVWYRSTTGNDPTEWSYYGLIAEEVAEVDPRLVHFGASTDCDCPRDDDGNLVDGHDVSCLTEPEGVQYDRLVPHLISLAQRQNATIQELTARIEALEAV